MELNFCAMNLNTSPDLYAVEFNNCADLFNFSPFSKYQLFQDG